MQTPELLLADLNRALRELRSAVGVLKDKSIDDKLLPIMKSTMLAEVLGDKWIVAIGGWQGAGKTRLVRTMYGLSSDTETDWLTDNEGRGERYPVLIQEVDKDKMPKPKGYLSKLVKSSDTYELKLEEARDIQEFRKACLGEMPEVMLPVLKVPREFFQNEGQALILLPGYETENRDNHEWQAFMRQVLIGAAGCIIVTDKKRLATEQQLVIVKDMLTSELRASRPLIVVSKTEGDANNQDTIEKLKQRAANVFKPKDASHEPRVICTGTDNENYIKQWLPEIKAALNDMSLGGGELRQHQLSRLEKLLDDDLNRVTNLIDSRTTMYIHNKAEKNPTVTNILEVFDEAVNELREDYLKDIEKMLSTQVAEARGKLDASLIAGHEGFWNTLKNIPNTFTETRRTLESDVTNAWNAPGDVLPKFAQLLDGVTQKKLRVQSGSITVALPSGHLLQRIGYMDAKDQAIPSKLTDPTVQANLDVLLRGTGGSTKELEETAKLLPFLALEFARMASILPELVGVNSATLETIPQMDILASVKMVDEQFDQFKDVAANVIRGLGAMLAVDIFTDGKIDTIPALLSALGLGGATAATATTATTTTVASGGGGAAVASGTAGAVAMSVAGVVAIGFLTQMALRQVHLHDKEVSAMAHAMLLKIKEQYLSHFKSHFEDLMRKMRAHLQQSLRHRYKLDQALMEQDRLTKALADVNVLQRDFLSELALSGQTLLLFGGKPA